MHRIADLCPDTARTDARVIAARTLPTLRAIYIDDDDLAAEAARISNRIRSLPTGTNLALKCVLGRS